MDFLKFFGIVKRNSSNKIKSPSKIKIPPKIKSPSNLQSPKNSKIRSSLKLKKQLSVLNLNTLNTYEKHKILVDLIQYRKMLQDRKDKESKSVPKPAKTVKKYRVNINLQNKNVTLLKKDIPIDKLNEKLDEMKLLFSNVVKRNKVLFNHPHQYHEDDYDYIIVILNKLIDNVIYKVNVIERMIVNDTYVSKDTPIYNYYVTNFMNLRNEIYNMFSNIKVSNSRILRYELKTFNNYITHYIENIID
jgi:hypothetical protein